MSDKDLNTFVDFLTSSSSGISSDECQNSTTTTSSIRRNDDDSISISSIKGSYQLPDEISKGASSTLGKWCPHSRQRCLGSAVIPKLYFVLDWEHKLQNLSSKACKASALSEIHLKCSSVFKNRLKDIETNVPDDLEAKLQLYKDWIIVLIKFNKNVFEDIENLENAVTYLQRTTRAYTYLSNSRRDLSTLMQLIANALYRRKWSFSGIKFETLQLSNVLGLNENDPNDFEILYKLTRGGLNGS